MTANDRVGERLADIFAHERKGAGCAGNMTVTPNEAWSYEARIAYRADDGEVYVTKQHYSVTTSRHTQLIRRALGRAGYVNMPDEEAPGWETWTRSRRRT